MSDKLKTRWTCPVCKRSTKVPSSHAPIRCPCGHVEYRDVTSLHHAKTRLEICELCKHYHDRRCDVIELGCRRSFMHELHSHVSVCPLGKWPSPFMRHMYQRPSVSKLNLIYHVYPARSNNVWRLNVSRVAAKMALFSGSCVVAVAVDETTHDVDEVRKAFGWPNIEYIRVPNDPALREAATLPLLLDAVHSTDAAEATFFAHTKGNSTKDNALGAEFWRNAMYHALLDNVHVCRDLLLRHPCVGTHKMCWPGDGPSPFPTRLAVGNWMYAGTFWWFRNQDVFSRDDWRQVPRDRYGAEAWLSTMFNVDDAATVFQPWPASEYPTASPYDPRLYRFPIRDPQ